MAFILDPAAIHIASVVTPIVLIFLRPMIRKLRGANPTWIKASVPHDFATGVALPNYFGMFYSLIQPDLIQQIDHHVLGIAGGMAIATFITELIGDTGPHREKRRM